MNQTASPAVEHVPDERLKEFCLAGAALLKHTVVHRTLSSVERATLARKTGRTTLLALVLVISSLSGGLCIRLPSGFGQHWKSGYPVGGTSARCAPLR